MLFPANTLSGLQDPLGKGIPDKQSKGKGNVCCTSDGNSMWTPASPDDLGTGRLVLNHTICQQFSLHSISLVILMNCILNVIKISTETKMICTVDQA